MAQKLKTTPIAVCTKPIDETVPLTFPFRIDVKLPSSRTAEQEQVNREMEVES